MMRSQGCCLFSLLVFVYESAFSGIIHAKKGSVLLNDLLLAIFIYACVACGMTNVNHATAATIFLALIYVREVGPKLQ